MRLLVVCTVPTDLSGIPNVVFNLFEAFDRSDMEIGYVSINPVPEEFAVRLKDMGIREYVIPRKISAPISYIRSLASVARGYDVVHVHGNSATMILEMLAASIAGVRVRIAHAHSISCSMKTIDRLMRPWFHKLCTGRLACSVAAGKWLFGKRPFEVVYNAVRTSRFAFRDSARLETREKLGLSGRKVIGHIGYFQKVKNQDFLIDMLVELLAKDEEYRLLLLGDGEMRSAIQDKTVRLGIADKVIMTGNVSDPEYYMNAMDMVCMPSLYEGLPLTMVEEQANGLTILASDTITREADKSGLVRFLPLAAGPEIWAQKAMEIMKKGTRSSEVSRMAIESIRKAGFDIIKVGADLKTFYLTTLRTLEPQTSM